MDRFMNVIHQRIKISLKEIVDKSTIVNVVRISAQRKTQYFTS